MISEYWGEFLVNPAPLEMSLSTCSHRCSYCFSNLNHPSRQADVPKIMRLLHGMHERKTLTAHLLREGYPVVISNRDDPFATSNYQQALPIMETLTALGVPINIQTKGGKGIAETLAFLKPSVWYISVSMLDEDLRAKIEPGAPSIEERFDMMRQVTAAGHKVILGLNPLVPEWLPGDDIPKVLTLAQEAGAVGAWIEILHMNYRQERRLTDRERAALTQPILDRARKKGAEDVQWAALIRAYETCGDLGLPFYSGGQPLPSDFWAPWRECYPKTYPVMQDFVNWCFDNLDDGAVVGFDAFAQALDGFPAGTWPIDGYMGNKAHHLWWKKQIPPQLTYRDLLKIVWSEPDFGLSPAKMYCFAYAATAGPDGEPQVITDAEGLPYLVFSSEMLDGMYTEVSEVNDG